LLGIKLAQPPVQSMFGVEEQRTSTTVVKPPSSGSG